MPQQNQEKLAFLNAALKNIPFDGLSIDMLEETSINLGHDKNYWKKVFPKGIKDLLKTFQQKTIQDLIQVSAHLPLQDMKIRERIFTLVQSYIKIIAPYKEMVRESLAFYALPQHALLAPKAVWSVANTIWYEAGDTSTDYNHYSKRTLLSGVISSTLLFWLNDTSENNERTWSFLQRRIDNVMTFGKAIGKVKSLISPFHPRKIFTSDFIKKKNGS